MKTTKELLQIDEEKLNKRFSQQQLECTHEKAKNFLTIKNDFKINRQSFKDLEIDQPFIHFLFVDKNSITNFSISTNFGNDLYFLIIICDAENLNNIDYNNCSVYIVDHDYTIQPYIFNAGVHDSIRDCFKMNVGQEIRSNSSINNITEYITFETSVVDQFRSNMSVANEMTVKLIVITNECSNGSNEVSEYLSNADNQNRFSLAFQLDPILGNGGFYDIGNMQP